MDCIFRLLWCLLILIRQSVSARRISQLKFDKLLLAHQDTPIVEGAREAVEKAARLTIEKTKDSA